MNDEQSKMFAKIVRRQLAYMLLLLSFAISIAVAGISLIVTSDATPILAAISIAGLITGLVLSVI